MGRQAKLKKQRRAPGRPKVELTPEERLEVRAVLKFRAEPIWKTGIAFDLWHESSGRDGDPRGSLTAHLMNIGLTLNQLADAVKWETYSKEALYTKAETMRRLAIEAIDGSTWAELRAERGEPPLGVRKVLEELAPRRMEPTGLRALGKVLVDAAQQFSGMLSEDLEYRRQYRHGARGLLPDLSMRKIADWIKARGLSTWGVAREIVTLGIDAGLVSPDDPTDHVKRIEGQLRKAIRVSDGK